MIKTGFEYNVNTIYDIFKHDETLGSSKYHHYSGYIDKLLETLFNNGCICPEHCDTVPCPHTNCDVYKFQVQIRELDDNEAKLEYIQNGGFLPSS